MKKRKIFLAIISAAIAICLALCVFMSACTVKIEIETNDDTTTGADDGGTSGGTGDDSEGKEHEHTYDVLKYDDEYHWYVCSCGEKDESTVTAHASTKGYEKDETNHWKVCDVCNQKFGTEAHDVTSGACVCGYEPEVHTHTYNVLKYDETGHWYECSCGEKDESTIAEHNSTGTDGSVVYDSDGTQHWEICAVCGYVTGQKENCTTAETAYQSDKNNHWHTCKVCGGEMDKGAHDTNGDEGACSICGYVQAELEETTVYMVGDSTMCSFNDAYYYPRYGYGTQVQNYIDEKATVVNLALSGRSSKSFLTESNYTTLTSSITSGDYLIIGFGHNDEKYDDADRFTSPELDAVETTGSFQNSLYYNYVKIALDKGATPILCTPIVRLNSSGVYTGNNAAHVVSGYGDYAACIRDLADDYNIECIDLTTLTGNLYASVGYDEAIYYHAWTNSKPTSVDTTHLNIYGAKEVAYLFASTLADTSCELGAYVLDGITAPTKEDLVVNPDYVESTYAAPDLTSSTWQSYKLGTLQNVDWYKTAFGDTGTGSPYSNGYSGELDSSNETITVGQSGSVKGKIVAGSDGASYVFTQFDSMQQFTISATATITTANCSTESGTAVANQSGFGIMLRDDMYAPVQDASILSNYAASGVYISNNTQANAIYWRCSNPENEDSHDIINSGLVLASVPKVGDTMTITLSRFGGGQSTTCTIVYGGQTYTYDMESDFDYRSSDPEYSYLCFYAARGTVVEFSNITLEIGEIGQA